MLYTRLQDLKGNIFMGKIKKLLVIAGSAKTGSTSLAKWLGQRDDMVLGIEKEGRYFTNFQSDSWTGPASDGFRDTLITDAASYEMNFPDLTDDQWAIDGSTDYIWADGTIGKLMEFAHTCEVKIICIAREPVSRAVSEYNHTLRHGWEDMSFSHSLHAEQDRRSAGWHPLFYHKRRSEIRDDIHRFHDAFGENLLVLDYQDMKTADVVLEKVAKFLGVPDKPVDSSKAHNVSLLEKNKLSGRLKRSKFLLSLGRILLPKIIKRWLWNALHVEAKHKTTMSDAEKQAYAALMAEEIAACKSSPLVPTDRWPSSE